MDAIRFRIALAGLIIHAARAYILEHVKVVPSERVEGTRRFINRCWEWQGGGDGRYGHAYFLGRRYKAHVLAYLAFIGTFKRHHVIDHHKCNNPACCSPFHLRAVTQSHNIKRAYALGRVRNPNPRLKVNGIEPTGVIIDEVTENSNGI
jgi:hypothetical protein